MKFSKAYEEAPFEEKLVSVEPPLEKLLFKRDYPIKSLAGYEVINEPHPRRYASAKDYPHNPIPPFDGK